MTLKDREGVDEPVVRCRGGRYYVWITHGLSRHDLKRVERTCGRALQVRTPALEVHVSAGAHLDAAAIFFLECLRARGALVTGLPDVGGSNAAP